MYGADKDVDPLSANPMHTLPALDVAIPFEAPPKIFRYVNESRAVPSEQFAAVEPVLDVITKFPPAAPAVTTVLTGWPVADSTAVPPPVTVPPETRMQFLTPAPLAATVIETVPPA
jgi:hypothetical protein